MADVAYAGSLQLLNEKGVGPAFEKATGLRYRGRGGGSLGLSKEIQAQEIAPNVFESVGSAPVKPLEPKFTNWYVRFAASPIVVAYSATSPFAHQLGQIAAGKLPLSELFTLMASPGFKLGRTNPATDPQGQGFAEMIQLATSQLHLPAGTPSRIMGSLTTSPQIFSETSLDAHLQAGQLDAASAFLSQAVQLHLPYISLPPTMNLGDPSYASTYAKATLALPGGKTVHGSPLSIDATTIGKSHLAAADAFIAYTLSPAGRNLYSKAGYTLLPPTAEGDVAAVPAAVRKYVTTASGSAGSAGSGSAGSGSAG